MSMAARKFDYVHNVFDKWGVTEEEKEYVLKSDIQKYIGTCMQWNDPISIRQFLQTHEEWDHERYLDSIEAEFKRVQELT